MNRENWDAPYRRTFSCAGNPSTARYAVVFYVGYRLYFRAYQSEKRARAAFVRYLETEGTAAFRLFHTVRYGWVVVEHAASYAEPVDVSQLSRRAEKAIRFADYYLGSSEELV